MASAVRRVVAIVLLISILLITSVLGYIFLVMPKETSSPGTENVPDQTQHAIRMDGNEEMLIQAKKYGWPGNGTASSPILISGLTIDSDIEFGMNISSTDLYFQVTGCIVHQDDYFVSESGYSNHHIGYGVMFSNVQNGELSNCAIISNQTGLMITGSQNISIRNNSIYGMDYGFLMSDSSNNQIANNTVHDQYDGLIFSGIRNMTFIGNTCQGKYRCLEISDSIEVEFRGNSFASYYDTTVELRGCSDGVFQGNTVTSEQTAMSIYRCGNESLVGNNIAGPMAITILSSESINISNNKLNGNMVGCLFLADVSRSSVMNNDLQGGGEGNLIANNSDNNSIIHNTFHDWAVGNYALDLKNGQGNLIRQNIFLKPNYDPYSGVFNVNRSMAFDDTGHNLWNDSVGGNYWSDLTQPDVNSDALVDLPYLIDGGHGAMDRLPLVNRP